jgi:hypothetical protein
MITGAQRELWEKLEIEAEIEKLQLVYTYKHNEPPKGISPRSISAQAHRKRGGTTPASFQTMRLLSKSRI